MFYTELANSCKRWHSKLWILTEAGFACSHLFIYFCLLSFKLRRYNLEACVTLRQISPKRIWQRSTLRSDCIRPNTAKERNILTGEIALEHIKVSVQICGIWEAPSPFPRCMKFATSHCLSRWCAAFSSALFLESSCRHQSVMPFSCSINVAYLSMPINQWHRTGSSLAANVVSFFLILKKFLKQPWPDWQAMHLADHGPLGGIQLL